MLEVQRVTEGDYRSEKESAAAFDRLVDESGLFRKVYREVQGYYIVGRPGLEPRSARCDRILVPSERLKRAGWTYDIGVELKKSGAKLGPVFTQVMDYAGAVFDVGPHYIMLKHWFVWPAPKLTGPIDSVTAHHRIGSVFSNQHRRLSFMAAGQNMILLSRDGELRVNLPKHGSKRGSR